MKLYEQFGNISDRQGNTLLHVAAQNGNKKIVKFMLKQPDQDIDAQNNSGQTALHYCYAYKYLPLAQVLVSKGANQHAHNKFGLSPDKGLMPARRRSASVERASPAKQNTDQPRTQTAQHSRRSVQTVPGARPPTCKPPTAQPAQEIPISARPAPRNPEPAALQPGVNKQNLHCGVRRINVTPRNPQHGGDQPREGQMPTINAQGVLQALKQGQPYIEHNALKHGPDTGMPSLNQNIALARQMVEVSDAERAPPVA